MMSFFECVLAVDLFRAGNKQGMIDAIPEGGLNDFLQHLEQSVGGDDELNILRHLVLKESNND